LISLLFLVAFESSAVHTLDVAALAEAAAGGVATPFALITTTSGGRRTDG
jgi:hypothetical protein